MKLGVFLMPQQPRTDDPVRRFRECFEQTRLACDAGFDAVAAGHHYVSPPYQALQNLPLLARLAGETGSRVMRSVRPAPVGQRARRPAPAAGCLPPRTTENGLYPAFSF